MAVAQNFFGPWDYVVVALVLLICASIGVYYRFTGGKQQTNQEYLLADKNMPIAPVAISLMASFMSAITLLGVSSEIYTFGLQFIVINISYGFVTPIAAYLYLPVFFRLQATSAYEYLELRFGKTARLAASICYSLQMILYMGIVLYAPALALEALTGINQMAAILAVGLVCTFYSTVGGMKAVLITDVFQAILMFAAVFSVIIHALVVKGSFSEIWRIAEEGNRTELLNFNPDPTVRHSWFSLLIGGGTTFLTLYGVNQTQVQRYLTIRDLKSAQKAVWLNWPITIALSVSTAFAGLAIYSKYYDCDPVKSGVINSVDQLMPLYVVQTMGQLPGLSGLFVSGIFSGSLSTVSASINSLAAVTIEDYYKPVYRRLFGTNLSEKRAAVHSKIIAFCYGLSCLGVAFLAQFLGGVLQAAITIFGVVGGPLLGFFTLGMFTITANEKGSLVGLASGLALSIWIGFGGPRPPSPDLPVRVDGCDAGTRYLVRNVTASVFTKSATSDSDYLWLYRMSYLYNVVFGLVCTILVGYICSWIINRIWGQELTKLNPNLFIPPVARRVEKMLDTPLNMKHVADGDLNGGTDSNKNM